MDTPARFATSFNVAIETPLFFYMQVTVRQKSPVFQVQKDVCILILSIVCHGKQEKSMFWLNV